MYDHVIKNARIVDGSGMPYYHGDVAFKDGKIVKIAPFINEDSTDIIDAADFVHWDKRCPGLKHVFVAGQLVVTDSVHDGRLLGKKLYRNW